MYILNKSTIVFLCEMNIIVFVRCESGSQKEVDKMLYHVRRLYIERRVIIMKKVNFFQMLYSAQYDCLRNNNLREHLRNKTK